MNEEIKIGGAVFWAHSAVVEEMTRLHQENEELREALEEIAAGESAPHIIAKAALGRKGE